MSLKKKLLIISIMFMVVFSFVAFNLKVSAISGGTQLNWNDIDNDGDDESSRIPTDNSGNQTPIDNPGNSTNGNGTNNNANTPGQLANTGLEDLPWAIMVVCVVSTVFAYKKIKEYKDA